MQGTKKSKSLPDAVSSSGTFRDKDVERRPDQEQVNKVLQSFSICKCRKNLYYFQLFQKKSIQRPCIIQLLLFRLLLLLIPLFNEIVLMTLNVLYWARQWLHKSKTSQKMLQKHNKMQDLQRYIQILLTENISSLSREKKPKKYIHRSDSSPYEHKQIFEKIQPQVFW